MYLYKNITVPFEMKTRSELVLQRCMEIANEQAKEGWRLVQIVTPADRMHDFNPYGYEIILEKEE